VKRWLCLFLVIMGIASSGHGQGKSDVSVPFTLAWSQGKCVGCKTAFELGRIQFVSRNEAWAVGFTYGPPRSQGSGDFIVVHTKDAGHTWTELPQTRQHAGGEDGPPAFSFVDPARGLQLLLGREAILLASQGVSRHSRACPAVLATPYRGPY